MHFVTSIFSSVHFSPGITPKTKNFPYRRGHFSRNCGVFRDIFFCGGSFSMFCAQNQDVSLPPHNFLHVLWRFPGHFPPWRQFLHVLPQKPGCFPIAPQFPPCFVAFFGTFSSVAAVSPCFAPKTRMFPYRPTISSMYCGAFQDIFFLGSIFSRKCGAFRDIFSPRWNRQNFCGEEY